VDSRQSFFISDEAFTNTNQFLSPSQDGALISTKIPLTIGSHILGKLLNAHLVCSHSGGVFFGIHSDFLFIDGP
jgi:hypothetical protein